MAFDDIRFPVDISYGSSGTPSYVTDIVILENGAENRAAIWSVALYKYDVSYGVKTLAQLQAVHAFFHGRVGRLRSFRFKDFTDFEAADSPIVLTGARTFQLTKRYTSGARTYDRIIRKLIAGVTLRRATVSFVDFTPDLDTGIFTFNTPDATANIDNIPTATINAITQASPAVVTTAAPHGFISNDIADISGVVGMTEVNGLSFTVTLIDPTSFSIGVDSSAFTAYSSAGTAVVRGITKSNPARVYAPTHGYSSTEVVFIRNVLGMTEINDSIGVITVVDADRFTIDIDSSAFTTFTDTAGAVAEQYIQPTGDALDWSGEFDVPVRFDSDELQASHDAFDIGAIGSIPLMEVLRD